MLQPWYADMYMNAYVHNQHARTEEGDSRALCRHTPARLQLSTCTHSRTFRMYYKCFLIYVRTCCVHVCYVCSCSIRHNVHVHVLVPCPYEYSTSETKHQNSSIHLTASAYIYITQSVFRVGNIHCIYHVHGNTCVQHASPKIKDMYV